jgi:hypothetical protein
MTFEIVLYSPSLSHSSDLQWGQIHLFNYVRTAGKTINFWSQQRVRVTWKARALSTVAHFLMIWSLCVLVGAVINFTSATCQPRRSAQSNWNFFAVIVCRWDIYGSRKKIISWFNVFRVHSSIKLRFNDLCLPRRNYTSCTRSGKVFSVNSWLAPDFPRVNICH